MLVCQGKMARFFKVGDDVQPLLSPSSSPFLIRPSTFVHLPHKSSHILRDTYSTATSQLLNLCYTAACPHPAHALPTPCPHPATPVPSPHRSSKSCATPTAPPASTSTCAPTAACPPATSGASSRSCPTPSPGRGLASCQTVVCTTSSRRSLGRHTALRSRRRGATSSSARPATPSPATCCRCGEV